MTKKDAPVFFGLPRPQYPPNPELLQSCLAWSIAGEIPGDKSTALIFERIAEPPNKKKMDWKYTNPLHDSNSSQEDQDRWRIALQAGGFTVEKNGLQNEITDAVATSLRGIQQKRAKGRTAIPISYHSALLQNDFGVQGVPGPPNFAKIINTIYSLGKRFECSSATILWYDAISNMATDNIVANLDTTIKKWLEPKLEDLESREKKDAPVVVSPRWLDTHKKHSPFSWFCTNWDKLMGSSWQRALPPRRWCDWATCLLRTAIGASYLWEARFFREIAEGLLNPSLDVGVIARKAVVQNPPLLVWRNSGMIESRDVTIPIRDTIRLGLNARKFILEELIGNKAPELGKIKNDREDGLVDWLARCRKTLKKNKHRDEFADALLSPWKGYHKNTYETVIFALSCREPLGEHADYYGLIENRGPRYKIIEPSPEWPVVIASLACPQAESSTRLGDVMLSLCQLGLKPSYETLIETLELAGLCRSSHDADEAIEVFSAF